MNLHPFNPNIGNRIQTNANGVSVDRGFIAHLVYANPIAADTDNILDGHLTSGSAVTVVDEFLAQPDFPRQISITPGGTTADVAAGNIVIEGTDASGEDLSENVAIAANAAAAVFTTKAFASIDKITFPQQDGPAATYDIGVTDKLGIPYALSHDTVLFAHLNNVKESTAPTVTINASDYRKNLIDLNSALNGNKVDVYLVV